MSLTRRFRGDNTPYAEVWQPSPVARAYPRKKANYMGFPTSTVPVRTVPVRTCVPRSPENGRSEPMQTPAYDNTNGRTRTVPYSAYVDQWC